MDIKFLCENIQTLFLFKVEFKIQLLSKPYTLIFCSAWFSWFPCNLFIFLPSSGKILLDAESIINLWNIGSTCFSKNFSLSYVRFFIVFRVISLSTQDIFWVACIYLPAHPHLIASKACNMRLILLQGHSSVLMSGAKNS